MKLLKRISKTNINFNLIAIQTAFCSKLFNYIYHIYIYIWSCWFIEHRQSASDMKYTGNLYLKNFIASISLHFGAWHCWWWHSPYWCCHMQLCYQRAHLQNTLFKHRWRRHSQDNSSNGIIQSEMGSKSRFTSYSQNKPLFNRNKPLHMLGVKEIINYLI